MSEISVIILSAIAALVSVIIASLQLFFDKAINKSINRWFSSLVLIGLLTTSIVIISIVVFPEWKDSQGTLLLLAIMASIGVVAFMLDIGRKYWDLKKDEIVLASDGKHASYKDDREQTTISLSNSKLSEANLENAQLQGVDLIEANLSKANLENANLRYANLSKANLQETNLHKANLLGANLTGANLTNAILTDCNLAEAILIGAVLLGADLTRANLSSAALSDEQRKQAKILTDEI